MIAQVSYFEIPTVVHYILTLTRQRASVDNSRVHSTRHMSWL